MPYAIPADNPFVNTPGARPEIWAYGLRNPWRMCYRLEDRPHLGRQQRPGSLGNGLLASPRRQLRMERLRREPPVLPRAEARPDVRSWLPTIEHSHAEFRSLTGGVVYHGKRFPELAGAYIYGDNSSGRIWGMKHDGERVIWHRELADTALQIAAFRVDHRGELLIADYGGGINRLVAAPKTKNILRPSQPLLSQTGLFTSTESDPG